MITPETFKEQVRNFVEKRAEGKISPDMIDPIEQQFRQVAGEAGINYDQTVSEINSSGMPLGFRQSMQGSSTPVKFGLSGLGKLATEHWELVKQTARKIYPVKVNVYITDEMLFVDDSEGHTITQISLKDNRIVRDQIDLFTGQDETAQYSEFAEKLLKYIKELKPSTPGIDTNQTALFDPLANGDDESDYTPNYEDGNFRVVCKTNNCYIPISESLRSPEKASKWAWENIFSKLDKAQEHVVALYLNNHLYTTAWKVVNKGSLDTSLIDTAAVIRNALLLGMPNIMIFHNHPSNNLDFSPADIKQTDALNESCKLLGLRLQDHIVFGSNGTSRSFTEFGHSLQGLSKKTVTYDYKPDPLIIEDYHQGLSKVDVKMLTPEQIDQIVKPIWEQYQLDKINNKYHVRARNTFYGFVSQDFKINIYFSGKAQIPLRQKLISSIYGVNKSVKDSGLHNLHHALADWAEKRGYETSNKKNNEETQAAEPEKKQENKKGKWDWDKRAKLITKLKVFQMNPNPLGQNNRNLELILKLMKIVTDEINLDDDFYAGIAEKYKVKCPPLDEKGERRTDPEALKIIQECTSKIGQTKNKYFKDGEYSPERQELHNQIIRELKLDKPCIDPPQQPVAIFTGGATASGKSAFISKHAKWLNSGNILHIDADAIRAKLPEYEGWNADITHEETKDIVDRVIREHAVPCRFDVLWDGTMNKTKNYIPLINQMKQEGYKTFIIFMDITQEESKKRALARYKKHGRFVPMEVIDDFFTRGKAALEELKKMVDGYVVVDNMGKEPQIIEQGGEPIPADRNYTFDNVPICQRKCKSGEEKPEKEKGNRPPHYYLEGDATEIETPSETIPAKYAIVDLRYVQPSNDPFTFEPNEAYPDSCQTRDYRSVKEEQEKVKAIADKFNAKYLLIDTPTALDGCPIITKDGYYVLGGNARTMAAKRVAEFGTKEGHYDDVYTEHLFRRMSIFGFDDKIIEGMKERISKSKQYEWRPFLVRIVDVKLDKCSTYSNILNKGMTQEFDEVPEAIAYSRQLEEDKKSLNRIAAIIGESEDDSFAELMSNSGASEEIIQLLRNAGIINRQSTPNWLTDGKTFSKTGKAMLEYMLLASVLPDKQLITMSKDYTNKILKALPYILQLRTLPAEWNLTEAIQNAIRLENKRRSAGFKNIDDYVNQIQIGKDALLTRESELVWRALSSTPTKFKALMKRYIQSAENATSESAMFKNDASPLDVLEEFVTKRNLEGLADDEMPAEQPRELQQPEEAAELPSLPTAKEIKDTPSPKSLKLNYTKGFFGNLLPKFKMFIKGGKGQGKSTFATKLAGDLAANGKVLYVLAEEDLAKGRVANRLRLAGQNSANIEFLELKPYGEENALERLLNYLNTGRYQFVIVDSMNILEDFGIIRQKEFINLIADFDNLSWVLIAQLDKTERKHRGLASWEFFVDTVVRVDNGTAYTEKHRDGMTGKMLAILPSFNTKYSLLN